MSELLERHGGGSLPQEANRRHDLRMRTSRVPVGALTALGAGLALFTAAVLLDLRVGRTPMPDWAAEPGAFAPRVEPLSARHNGRSMLFGDARTVVRHCNENLLGFKACRNRNARARMADAILDEVAEGFAKILGVDRSREAFGNIDLPIELLALRCPFDDANDTIDDSLHVG